MCPQAKPTLGFISTWPIYQGTTIDRYAHSLLQGISAAAHETGCNLLLGCGFRVSGNSPQRPSFWPAPGAGVDFVPVGPWNTDGLIIVPDELTESQLQYVRDLQAARFPLIFTTPEGPGHRVKVDNALGIRAALIHLMNHGHRQIAFIAGNANGRGDSRERLSAYRDLDNGGKNEMYRWWFDNILERGVPFDLIGVSYYPYWHGSFADLQENLNDIAVHYNKDIVVVETSYAFTRDDKDNYENVIRFEEKPGYPFTPEGQARMLGDVMTIVRAVPNRRGLGVMWWDATWTAVPGNGWDPFHSSAGNNWENQALFDYDNRALPAMGLFGQP